MSDTPATPSAIERCGFCGMFYIGTKYMTTDELNATPQSVLDAAPLGYCPNAGYEEDAQWSANMYRVTRDMAIDAGDLSLEGQFI
jgi:hypothetical protein